MNKVKQQIPIFFDVGLNQKTDDVFSQGLYKAENAEYKKAGSLSKRDGFSNLSNQTIPFYDIGVVSQSVDVYASASFFSPERTSWYAPLHLSGTITASAGGNRSLLYDRIETAFTTFTSSWSGLPSWVVYHEISGGSDQNKVFKNIGYKLSPSASNGNRSCYYHLINNNVTSHIDMNVYGDWSTVDVIPGNPTVGTASYLFSDTGEIKYWMTVNEYALAAFVSSSNGFRFFYLGDYYDTVHTKPSQRGVAFLSSSVTSGSNVVLTLDRNTDQIFEIGQNIMIVNQTPQGQSLVSGAISIAPITAMTGNTMTVARLFKDHVSGSILGIYPIKGLRPNSPTGTNGPGGSFTYRSPITCYGTASSDTFNNSIDIFGTSNEDSTNTVKQAHMYPLFDLTVNIDATRESRGHLYHYKIGPDWTDASNVTFLAMNGDYDQIYKCFSRFENGNLGTTYHYWLQVQPVSGALGVTQ